MSMWLRKRGDKHFFEGHMKRRRGDEQSFGDRVNRKRIFSDYVDRRGGDVFTTRSGEEVTENGPFQGQVIGQ
jgi:hypothetical protein